MPLPPETWKRYIYFGSATINKFSTNSGTIFRDENARATSDRISDSHWFLCSGQICLCETRAQTTEGN
jgi:hypothetical protein